MKRKRNQLFVTALTAAMAVSLLSPAEPAAAAKKVKFNVKKLSLTVGKKKTLKIKNAKKKAKWSIKSRIKLNYKKKRKQVLLSPQKKQDQQKYRQRLVKRSMYARLL